MPLHEQVGTPSNWTQGEDVIIAPAVSNEAAAEKYRDGWETRLPYLRQAAGLSRRIATSARPPPAARVS